MMTRHLGIALTLAAGAALALGVAQDHNLKRTAKVGETFRYKITGELEVMGQQVGMTATMVTKTVKVEPNGNFTVESTQTEGKINFGGNEMDLPESGGTTTVYKPDGTVLDVQGEGVEMGGWRMANLMASIIADRPLKVGDTWTSETKGDPKKQTVDVKGTYKFEAVEKTDQGDTAKVVFEVKETGGDAAASISGTVWIELKTGNAVRVETKWKDVPVPGAPTPVSGKMTMVLLP